MGRANCDFEMRVYKDPPMDGDDGEKSFGSEIVLGDENEEEDAALALFRDWLAELADGQMIWREVWAQSSAWPDVATPDQRSEAIRADSPSRSMAPLNLGAPELDVAVARPRKLAFEFRGGQTGSDTRERRRERNGSRNDRPTHSNQGRHSYREAEHPTSRFNERTTIDNQRSQVADCVTNQDR